MEYGQNEENPINILGTLWHIQNFDKMNKTNIKLLSLLTYIFNNEN